MTKPIMNEHPEFAHFRVVAEVEVVIPKYAKNTARPPDAIAGFAVMETGETKPPKGAYCFHVVGKIAPWWPEDDHYVCYDDGDLFVLQLEDTRPKEG